jgi:hypothetical protein
MYSLEDREKVSHETAAKRISERRSLSEGSTAEKGSP